MRGNLRDSRGGANAHGAVGAHGDVARARDTAQIHQLTRRGNALCDGDQEIGAAAQRRGVLRDERGGGLVERGRAEIVEAGHCI